MPESRQIKLRVLFWHTRNLPLSSWSTDTL
jgi:hypothetical protein